MRLGKKQFLIKKFVQQIQNCSYLMIVYVGDMSNFEFKTFSKSIGSEGFKSSKLKNSLVSEALKLRFSNISSKDLSIFINCMQGNVCLVYPVVNQNVYTIPKTIRNKNKSILLASLYVLKSNSIFIMNKWTSFELSELFLKGQSLIYLDFFWGLNTSIELIEVLSYNLRLLTMIKK